MGKIHKPYDNFKGWLRANRLTYSDVAKVLGNTATTVSAKINGQSDFSLSEIKVLKEVYHLSTEIFL